jgi:hypothetical protein
MPGDAHVGQNCKYQDPGEQRGDKVAARQIEFSSDPRISFEL